jgi:hypothetical protein
LPGSWLRGNSFRTPYPQSTSSRPQQTDEQYGVEISDGNKPFIRNQSGLYNVQNTVNESELANTEVPAYARELDSLQAMSHTSTRSVTNTAFPYGPDDVGRSTRPYSQYHLASYSDTYLASGSNQRESSISGRQVWEKVDESKHVDQFQKLQQEETRPMPLNTESYSKPNPKLMQTPTYLRPSFRTSYSRSASGPISPISSKSPSISSFQPTPPLNKSRFEPKFSPQLHFEPLEQYSSQVEPTMSSSTTRSQSSPPISHHPETCTVVEGLVQERPILQHSQPLTSHPSTEGFTLDRVTVEKLRSEGKIKEQSTNSKSPAKENPTTNNRELNARGSWNGYVSPENAMSHGI